MSSPQQGGLQGEAGGPVAAQRHHPDRVIDVPKGMGFELAPRAVLLSFQLALMPCWRWLQSTALVVGVVVVGWQNVPWLAAVGFVHVGTQCRENKINKNNLNQPKLKKY